MHGLYVHIPFCVRKCGYCDFVSYCGQESRHDEYIDALISEMSAYKGEQVDTVFIGGGTPTVLSAPLLNKLCTGIRNCFDLQDKLEFTCEANPGTLSEEKLDALLEGGVNRLSIGVQSFNDNELQCIGRIHSAKEAYDTVLRAKQAGFDNISIDLMTALPFQTMDSLKNSLKTAVSLPVKHISAYSLIIEDNTPIADEYRNGKIVLPDENEDREMYSMTSDFLKEHGLFRYEISNYAVKGYESRHNMKYWKCEEYYGIGAAAHSYINRIRFSNTSDLDKYISGEFRSGEEERLTREDMISEFIIMGMRMDKGISKKEFQARFGTDIESIYGNELRRFTETGFIIADDFGYRFSDKGRNVSNAILCEFV